MSFAEYNVFRHGHKDKGCTTPRKEMSDVQIDIDTWVFIYRALRRFNSSSSYVDRRRLNYTFHVMVKTGMNNVDVIAEQEIRWMLFQ